MEPTRTQQTYVLDDIEVCKTGRVAYSMGSPGGKKRELVEVTPVLSTVGSWKKWVYESTLFVVQQ